MRPGGGKPKGNSYEIKICRILSKWYSPQIKQQDHFWRTAGSGAKATRGKSAETSFFGDITYLPQPDALQVWIDCKSVKTVTFNNMLTDRFLPLKWYKEECRKQRETLKKKATTRKSKPVLIIFKLHRKAENYVFFNFDDFEIYLPSTTSITVERFDCKMNAGFIVMELEEFLDNLNKKEIVDA